MMKKKRPFFQRPKEKKRKEKRKKREKNVGASNEKNKKNGTLFTIGIHYCVMLLAINMNKKKKNSLDIDNLRICNH